MILKEEDKDLLRRITVRTANVKQQKEKDKDEVCNFGTGTIIGSGDDYYVMTAGHCVDGMDEKHIIVEVYDGNSFVSLEVLEVVHCVYKPDENQDYAVLRIEQPNSDIDYSQIIKRFDLTIREDLYFMMAYPPTAREGRLFEVKKNIGDFWEVVAEVNCSHDDFKSLISGSSGSGIFVYRHNRFYYVGMAVATRDGVGRFNDVKVAKPNVFDDYLPDDTKDVDYFDTLKSWEDWNDNLNAEARRNKIRGMDVEWLDYLTRKSKVLFPSEYDKKVDAYIKYYLKGLKIITDMLQSNPSFVNELNKVNDKFFDKFIENHKEDFETSDGAYQDLSRIIDEIKKNTAPRFPEDKDGVIANDYAMYRIAERLLNCQLDYKSKA